MHGLDPSSASYNTRMMYGLKPLTKHLFDHCMDDHDEKK